MAEIRSDNLKELKPEEIIKEIIEEYGGGRGRVPHTLWDRYLYSRIHARDAMFEIFRAQEITGNECKALYEKFSDHVDLGDKLVRIQMYLKQGDVSLITVLWHSRCVRNLATVLWCVHSFGDGKIPGSWLGILKKYCSSAYHYYSDKNEPDSFTFNPNKLSPDDEDEEVQDV